jgi:TonB family protein
MSHKLFIAALPASACAATFVGNHYRAQTPAARPEVVRAVAPWFSPLAKLASAGGTATAEVEIDAAGKVTSAKMTGGHRLLEKSVVEAARRWEFAPASAEGRRSVTLAFEFTSMAKSHGTYAPEELTPVFTPPYEVEVFLSDTAVRQGSK